MDLEKQVQGILSKLNFIESHALNNYIRTKTMLEISRAQELLQNEADEKEKKLKEINRYTWDIISETLSVALMENRISKERIKKIYSRMAELTRKTNQRDLYINEDLKDVKVVKKEELYNLIELAIDTSCRDCKRHSKHCRVYKLLKQYDVPKPTGEHCKCKYAYGGE
ncbi:hypothetical protein BJV85_002069 [Clostridium acetobutylicum]|uniref:DUF5651 domain-containing protein n=1 Tax=Clostridium acetobutylicum (strain ATCC 824 / DSM 792 / JCM 1419 / IAM 19013 / LMG 5710 / NBRC 13948 / NRRL B-527 / VKM B-1787 / 2291 / W) TaxID=272562 RepID=Q97HT3_CLOAB|nr:MULTISPECIES: DUF5651 domain-containing protein [Clostridium]AAK79887.1 Hypothetical protein CA_C1924 [Clostridium acetobutylicum ATCC 824]ADZ20976.1 Conserved hypothetical protein [Clostridium acetobutylicum EA 2018]AEI32063.1 hypothetical protein SMB_G1952 [Clostridium acetobutylicum DSM 1731]AWV79682.1 hypothetical protein DK921_06125 [Clostridium acetobutylicum]MBC2394342.1 hypothetical protein [Clostridium acetobutylicum]